MLLRFCHVLLIVPCVPILELSLSLSALHVSLPWCLQRPLPIHAGGDSYRARSSAVSESMLQLPGGDVQKYRVQGTGLLTLSRKRLGGRDPHITPGTAPDLLTWAF
ncbi:uncharacterized protein LY79DRAFT_556012 [Colletotrichum navitas]|uniref:Secreted protein n=1 Tax=Colletotrichum navitas TaxID=681940 RepID=A0AAD8PZA9_9PEZI|nr:uncharacterized protein LY79DRAFT_556012 [Colletotrichum navitas]KAK1589887.1 hypothetical protein LY79DRAFT_556012 [Colletotrichum navitas]